MVAASIRTTNARIKRIAISKAFPTKFAQADKIWCFGNEPRDKFCLSNAQGVEIGAYQKRGRGLNRAERSQWTWRYIELVGRPVNLLWRVRGITVHTAVPLSAQTPLAGAYPKIHLPIICRRIGGQSPWNQAIKTLHSLPINVVWTNTGPWDTCPLSLSPLAYNNLPLKASAKISSNSTHTSITQGWLRQSST